MATRITLTPEQLAEIVGQEPTRDEVASMASAFAGWNDELQAQFFVEVARCAREWENHAGMQWYRVGGHLRDCECSTPEARELVEGIYEGMKPEGKA